MSDLCHNCGSCHLGLQPTPCALDLQHCVICSNLGHTFNFCPLSVLAVDPNYRYWMLCHNCDQWHLPSPCQRPLIQCNACGCKGHLPSFCPRYPQTRLAASGNGAVAGNKRPHSSISTNNRPLVPRDPDPEQPIQVQNISQVHPELTAKICYSTAMVVSDMLKVHPMHEIVEFYAEQAGRPLVTDTGPSLHSGSLQPVVLDQQPVEKPFQLYLPQPPASRAYQNPSGQGRADSPDPPTPAPSAVAAKRQQSVPNQFTQPAYQTTQVIVEQAEQAPEEAHSQAQQSRAETAQLPTEPQAADSSTPAQKKKAKLNPKPRAPKGNPTRCDACKRRHARCTHMKADGQPFNPNETTPVPESSSPLSAVASLPGSGVRGASAPPTPAATGAGQIYNEGQQYAPEANIAIPSVERDMSPMAQNGSNQVFYQGNPAQATWLRNSSANIRGANPIASTTTNTSVNPLVHQNNGYGIYGQVNPLQSSGGQYNYNAGANQMAPQFEPSTVGNPLSTYQQGVTQTDSMYTFDEDNRVSFGGDTPAPEESDTQGTPAPGEKKAAPRKTWNPINKKGGGRTKKSKDDDDMLC